MSGLDPCAPGLRISVGVPGSGKSYGIGRDVKAAIRQGVWARIVDPEGEWKTIPEDIAGIVSRVNHIADCTTPVGIVTHKTKRETRIDVDEACRWCVEDDENGQPTRGRAVVCHEAWMAAGRKDTSEEMEAMARTWRHTDSIVWLDAQRITLISRDIIDIATELRIYTQVGDRDIAILRDIGGRALVEAIDACGARFDKGESGWHVTLTRSRRPPYEIER